MNKKPQIWTFTKIDDEWKSEINVDFLFYVQTTLGVPYDIVLDKIKDLSMSERLEGIRASWKIFAKENNIDLKPIKEKNESRKEEYVEAIKKIHNL